MRIILFALGATLSVVDAAFSLLLAGTFHEVNPLLRPLLAWPAVFLVVKTVLAVAGMGSLSRLDSRVAGAALLLAIGAYAGVDGYWVVSHPHP
jgi:hypothetical protein